MKRLLLLMLILNAALMGVAVFFIVSRGYEPGAGFDGVQLLTIVLTALAVLLTALGIFVALLAILGYAAIRDLAVRRAEAEARSTAQKTARSTAEQVAGQVTANHMSMYSGDDIGAAAAKGEPDDARD